MCWDVGRCGEVWGRCGKVWGDPTHSSTPSPTSLPTPSTLTRHLHTHPTTLPHTHLTRLSTLPSHFPTPLTPSITSPLTHLTPSPHLPQNFSSFPNNPHTSSNTSPYFINYPISKFPTFLIYCQISLAIK